MANRFAGYFPSGSNHPGEIEGFRAVGAPVGVAVAEVNERALQALEGYAETGGAVFVDSGAFSEFGNGVEPDWEKVLGIYERLAGKLGNQVYVVAPDKVGDQEETLARLARYRWRLLKLRRLGANIIVPVQRGDLSMAEFAAELELVLGFTDWIRGIPLKRAATKFEELAEFAATLKAGTRVHLLGKGPYSRGFEKWYGLVAHCKVTTDSVRVRALVGRESGLGAYTIAQDEVRKEYGLPFPALGDNAITLKREALIRVAEVVADLGCVEHAERPEVVRAAKATAAEPVQLSLVA
jgi:hypothetical protein